MKRRIFTVILAVMIVTTFMPAASFGVSSFGPASTGEQSYKIAVPDKPGQRIYTRHSLMRNKILHNEDMLEYLKQALIEERDAILDNIEGQEKYYCPEVWNCMMELSAEFTAMVENADSFDDLGEIVWIFLAPKDEVMRPLYDIQRLESLTIQEVSSSKDLPRLKKLALTNMTEYFKMFSKADFTLYYWGILQTKKKELTASINSIKTFRDYIRVQAELQNDGFGFIGGSTYFDDFDSIARLSDLLDDEDDEDYDDDDDEYYFYSSWLYDKYEVEEYREMFGKWAEDLLNVDMKDMGYTTAAKDFATRLKAFKKQIAAEVDCDVMYNDYCQFQAEVYKKANQKMAGKEPASYGDILRLEKKMKDIFYKGYKSKNYSDIRWSELNSVYSKYVSRADGFFYQDQINDKFLTEMKTALNKVPTLAKEKQLAAEKAKKELKALKTKRIKQIKKYAKNKKFDHKKSIPLAKKAAKKIRAAKTKKKVNQIYKTYKAKIKKTAVKKDKKGDKDSKKS